MVSPHEMNLAFSVRVLRLEVFVFFCLFVYYYFVLLWLQPSSRVCFFFSRFCGGWMLRMFAYDFNVGFLFVG